MYLKNSIFIYNLLIIQINVITYGEQDFDISQNSLSHLKSSVNVSALAITV